MTEDTLAEDNYTNGQKNTTHTHGFWNTVTRTEETAFESSVLNNYGVNVGIEISGEFLGIGAKATSGFEWSTTRGTTDRTTEKHERTLQWRTEFEVPPGASVRCKAYAQQGKFEGEYSSKASLLLQDGRTFEFEDRGNMRTTSYSEAWSKCEDSDGNEMIPLTKRSVRRSSRGRLGM